MSENIKRNTKLGS